MAQRTGRGRRRRYPTRTGQKQCQVRNHGLLRRRLIFGRTRGGSWVTRISPEGPRVCRLAGGAKRIRTVGPTSKRWHLSLFGTSRFSAAIARSSTSCSRAAEETPQIRFACRSAQIVPGIRHRSTGHGSLSRYPLCTARSFQLVEQGLCLFEIGGGEAFGEPAVDRGSRARSAEADRNRPLHVGALGASNGLKALERLALVFKPEK
jgi:hypothetical protein